MVARRRFLALSAGSPLAGLLPGCRGTGPGASWDPRDVETPVFDLHRHLPRPVTIESIELLEVGPDYLAKAVKGTG